jgi:glucose/arabinose dehydrogenase
MCGAIKVVKAHSQTIVGRASDKGIPESSFIHPFLKHILCIVVVAFCGAFFFPVGAATVPAGFTETPFASGLTNPTAMAFAPDGRLFVCLQGGQLRVIKNGALLPTPFLTVSVDSSGERGLLGVAFDPNFSVNNFVYIYYTTSTAPVHNRVSRFTANGDVAVGGSEVPILELNNLSSATNHNGGAIHFGLDGKLYVAVGDNANGANSQTLTNLLGKMLRINPDGTIPTDNPFFNSTSGNNRAIWAIGLRNPFTFDFHPTSGRMFINDVGEVTWEEINDGIAGSNYGWPNSEGPTTNPSFRGPIFAYQHGTGPTTGCAVTGGVFYNPSTQQFPSTYVGNYFFADLCSGWIRRLDPANSNTVSPFASGIPSPVDLKVGPDGSLYYLARGNSSIFKISYTATPTPIPTPTSTPMPTPSPSSTPPAGSRASVLASYVSQSADFDGDGRTDIAVWRSATSEWHILNSANNSETVRAWGDQPGDIPVAADYDGDGRADIAIYRPTDGGNWYIINSSNGSIRTQQWGGVSGDIPVAADYDGDGRADLAVFRPTTGGFWRILNSSNGSSTIRQWGDTNGDIPVPADYDGDKKADLAIYRPTTGGLWYIVNSSNGSISVRQWGDVLYDVPVPGDYDGDGRADLAIYRPTTGGLWYIVNSSNGTRTIRQWGDVDGDIPVPGRYDADGKADIAIWRASTGMWYIINSSNGTTKSQQLGIPGLGDVPVSSMLVGRMSGSP